MMEGKASLREAECSNYHKANNVDGYIPKLSFMFSETTSPGLSPFSVRAELQQTRNFIYLFIF